MSMAEATETKIPYEYRHLNEQCDRCGASGMLVALLTTGGELVFCGHHAYMHAKDIMRRVSALVLGTDFDLKRFTKAVSA